MKYTYLLLIALGLSCKEKKSYCDYVLPGNTGFMVSNGFFEDYDKKGDHYAILNRVDPTSLESFEYFTGNGFSKTDLMAIWVYAKDTCSLKSKYVEWTLKQQSDTAKKGTYTFSATTTEPNIIHDTIYIHDTVYKTKYRHQKYYYDNTWDLDTAEWDKGINILILDSTGKVIDTSHHYDSSEIYQ